MSIKNKFVYRLYFNICELIILYLTNCNNSIRWNYLLGYNVAVIVIKTFLQLLGCVFLESLAYNACWFVQLFGIACVKKFWDTSDDEQAASKHILYSYLL